MCAERSAILDTLTGNVGVKRKHIRALAAAQTLSVLATSCI